MRTTWLGDLGCVFVCDFKQLTWKRKQRSIFHIGPIGWWWGEKAILYRTVLWKITLLVSRQFWATLNNYTKNTHNYLLNMNESSIWKTTPFPVDQIQRVHFFNNLDLNLLLGITSMLWNKIPAVFATHRRFQLTEYKSKTGPRLRMRIMYFHFSKESTFKTNDFVLKTNTESVKIIY